MAPAVLCALTSIFAVWQIGLVVAAGGAAAAGSCRFSAVVAAAASVLAIGALLYDRAVPALAELWNIYSGDEELGDLAISVSPDGTTLYIDGTYGMGSDQAVRRALEQNPKIRDGRAGRSRRAHRRGLRDQPHDPQPPARHARRHRLRLGLHHRLPGRRRPQHLARRRLGFHQGELPRHERRRHVEANRDMKRFLSGAGVAPDFAQRVLDTPGDSIWVPTQEELLAARVIKRVNR